MAFEVGRNPSCPIPLLGNCEKENKQTNKNQPTLFTVRGVLDVEGAPVVSADGVGDEEACDEESFLPLRVVYY